MNVELKFLNASHIYERFNYSKVEKLTRLKKADQSRTMKKEREKERREMYIDNRDSSVLRRNKKIKVHNIAIYPSKMYLLILINQVSNDESARKSNLLENQTALDMLHAFLEFCILYHIEFRLQIHIHYLKHYPTDESIENMTNVFSIFSLWFHNQSTLYWTAEYF